jgi:hypothetical protein
MVHDIDRLFLGPAWKICLVRFDCGFAVHTLFPQHSLLFGEDKQWSVADCCEADFADIDSHEKSVYKALSVPRQIRTSAPESVSEDSGIHADGWRIK